SARRGVHQPEELGDVLPLLFRQRRVRVEIASEELRALEELVKELGGRELRGALRVRGEVLAERLRRRDRLGREARLGTCDLFEHVAQRTLAAAARLGRARELHCRERVERRDREAVDVTRVGGQRDRRKKRDEQPDLGSLVELSPTREMRGDLPPRERVEERRRVAVVPNEDREVAVTPLVAERFACDDVRDLL